MAYRVILFDFGETLAQTSFDVWGATYLPFLRRHGFRCSQQQVADAWRKAWEGVDTLDGVEHPAYSTSAEAYDTWRAQIEQRALAHLGIEQPSSDLMAGILDLQDRRRYVLFDDALPTLAALRERGYRLGIISNFTWRLPEIAEELGLAPYLEHVVVSARVGYRKPHLQIFRRALAAFEVAPDQALLVGDSPLVDVEGARRAGMSGVLLNRSGTHAGYEPTVRDLSALLELVGVAS